MTLKPVAVLMLHDTMAILQIIIVWSMIQRTDKIDPRVDFNLICSIKSDSFRAWDCDFLTPQVVSILPDLLILKMMHSEQFRKKVFKPYVERIVNM